MKHTFIVLGILLICMTIAGCSDSADGNDGEQTTRTLTSSRPAVDVIGEVEGVEIDDTPWIWNVIDKVWYLTELRQSGVVGIVPYQDIQTIPGAVIFTVNFSAEGGVHGIGVINNYFGPYTLGDGQAIWIKEMAVTEMYPLNEPDRLKEYDFFNYLVNIYKWSLVENPAEGYLELYSLGEDGKETVLVFNALAFADPD